MESPIRLPSERGLDQSALVSERLSQPTAASVGRIIVEFD
jgi:hypothetical protein